MNSVYSMLEAYLRQTNGHGERILLNPQLPIKLFYHSVASLFHTSSLSIYLHGVRIDPLSEGTITDLGAVKGDIFHLKEEGGSGVIQKEEGDCVEVRVFYKGQIYSYKTKTASSTIFLDVYLEITSNDGPDDSDVLIPILIYLGNKLPLTDTFSMHGIRNGDMLTLAKVPILSSSDIQTVHFLQEQGRKIRKINQQSVTLATSGHKLETPKHESCFQTRELLRKSSMKSSHQSRQFNRCEQKLLRKSRTRSEGKSKEDSQIHRAQQDTQRNSLNRDGSHKILRHIKSSSNQLSLSLNVNTYEPFEQPLEANAEEGQQQLCESGKMSSSGGFDLFTHSWLTNKKVIETESINCEEQIQDDPLLWLDCKIAFQNTDKTREYVFDCGESTTLLKLFHTLKKLETQHRQQEAKGLNCNQSAPCQRQQQKASESQCLQSLYLKCCNEMVQAKINDKEAWEKIKILELARELETQELPSVVFSC